MPTVKRVQQLIALDKYAIKARTTTTLAGVLTIRRKPVDVVHTHGENLREPPQRSRRPFGACPLASPSCLLDFVLRGGKKKKKMWFADARACLFTSDSPTFPKFRMIPLTASMNLGGVTSGASEVSVPSVRTTLAFCRNALVRIFQRRRNGDKRHNGDEEGARSRDGWVREGAAAARQQGGKIRGGGRVKLGQHFPTLASTILDIFPERGKKATATTLHRPDAERQTSKNHIQTPLENLKALGMKRAFQAKTRRPILTEILESRSFARSSCRTSRFSGSTCSTIHPSDTKRQPESEPRIRNNGCCRRLQSTCRCREIGEAPCVRKKRAHNIETRSRQPARAT